MATVLVSLGLAGGCATVELHSAVGPAPPNAPSDPQQSVDLSGELSSGDRLLDDNSFADSYTLEALAGDRIHVEMSSEVFSPHLFVVDPDGVTLTRNEAKGHGAGLEVNTMLPKDGSYVIYFNATEPDVTGPYGARLKLWSSAQSNETPQKSGGNSSEAPDVRQPGRLNVSDSGLMTNGSLVQAYQFTLPSRQSVAISMNSEAFDTFLRVLDAEGNVIAENDDRSDFNFNSQIKQPFPPGTYTVLASSYGVLQQGQFSLALSGWEAIEPLASSTIPFARNGDLGLFDVEDTVARLAAQSTDRDELAVRFRSIVQVYVGASTGSGTLLTDNGLLLTNFHVLAPDDESEEATDGPIYVGLALEPDRPVTPLFQATIERSAPEDDLALLQITGDLFGNDLPSDLEFDTIPMGDPNSVNLGEAVTVLGFPGTTAIQAGGASYLTLTQGVVSAILSRRGKRYDFLSDVTVNAGNSGGATLNAKGELIAVPSGTVSETGSSPSDIDEASVLRAITAIPDDWLPLIR